MHAAMIFDDERLAQEQSMLNRLCVGLIGEGVRITRIVSENRGQDRDDANERRMALATRLETPMRVLPWMRRMRLARLVERLERSPPDVLYAVGLDAWRLAMDIAKAMNLPLVLDVWTHRLIERIPTGARAKTVSTFVAPTQSIAQTLSQRVGADLVSLVPMGVAARDHLDRSTGESTSEGTIAILGDCRDIAAYRAMLAGLSRASKDVAQLQIVLELHGAHEHDVWREAGRLNLLGRVSAINNLTTYKNLLGGCQLVLVPERFGDLRSVMLEAMAQASAFIVSAESPLDMFIDERTALCVHALDAESWGNAIVRLLAQRDECTRLGENAQQFVLEHYRSSNQVQGLISTFEGVFRGGAISFPGTDAKSLPGKH